MHLDTTVAPQLLLALRDIEVAEDRCSVRMRNRTLTGDSPRSLQQTLASAMYQLLHTGRDTENRAVRVRRDPAFERELARAVPHQETDLTVILHAAPEEGADATQLLVERDGVRVWVPTQAVQGRPQFVPGERLRMRASTMRPALSPGFFLVTGSRRPAPGVPLLRIYVHVRDAGSAGRIWSAVLGRLEDAGAHYNAKILSAPEQYPRQDSLVIYVSGESAPVGQYIADAIGGMPGVGPGTSPFTRTLAQGVAVSWEPNDPRPGATGLSFGQHRAGALAEALMTVAPNASSLERERVIADAFRAANIDPADPSRNLDSPAL
ncbi:T3SS effector HopA1 family protein [Streptomyces sioyaensis]|uniref:T3SS effector HopA1 family protein n=1 Tax=Streptomyces sioyaensis TaxID=67364 RepID=UPI0037B7B17B